MQLRETEVAIEEKGMDLRARSGHTANADQCQKTVGPGNLEAKPPELSHGTRVAQGRRNARTRLIVSAMRSGSRQCSIHSARGASAASSLEIGAGW